MQDIMNDFYAKIGATSSVAPIIISIAFMLFAGFLMTRITKLLHLPNVTAYIIAGIIIGPFCLCLVPSSVQSGMSFITDIALAFIAFSVGEYFKVDSLKNSGWKVIVITLFEALVATLFVFILCYFILRLNLAFSAVLAALASATAPASTIMTIRQTGAKGEYVETLLQVVALDDVVSLVAYSVAVSIAVASQNSGGISFETIGLPIIKNLAALLIGGAFGFILKWLMPKKRTTDNRLIISIAMLFTFCGICALLDQSPLLGCMAMGMVYINFSKDDKLFMQLNYFSPPILLLFFVLSGMSFNLNSLVGTSSIGTMPLLVVGILYFFVRIIGKYVGAYLGCLITRKPKELRNYLGLGLIPQAGVAIGLAALGARLLGGELGSDLQTIILASCVLYEMIGPACAKLGLYLSHSYSNKIEEVAPVSPVTSLGKPKTDAEILIEEIQTIQSKMPQRPEISKEEEAFNEAAEQQYEDDYYNSKQRRFINRR
ncbi:MAG: cation:proton antiporter [Bacilli bacterium]|jgi:Kef-type K+ transport system membrane component KefB